MHEKMKFDLQASLASVTEDKQSATLAFSLQTTQHSNEIKRLNAEMEQLKREANEAAAHQLDAQRALLLENLESNSSDVQVVLQEVSAFKQQIMAQLAAAREETAKYKSEVETLQFFVDQQKAAPELMRWKREGERLKEAVDQLQSRATGSLMQSSLTRYIALNNFATSLKAWYALRLRKRWRTWSKRADIASSTLSWKARVFSSRFENMVSKAIYRYKLRAHKAFLALSSGVKARKAIDNIRKEPGELRSGQLHLADLKTELDSIMFEQVAATSQLSQYVHTKVATNESEKQDAHRLLNAQRDYASRFHNWSRRAFDLVLATRNQGSSMARESALTSVALASERVRNVQNLLDSKSGGKVMELVKVIAQQKADLGAFEIALKRAEADLRTESAAKDLLALQLSEAKDLLAANKKRLKEVTAQQASVKKAMENVNPVVSTQVATSTPLSPLPAVVRQATQTIKTPAKS